MEDILIDGLEFEQLAGEILDRGHVLKFRARGYSMSPFIRDKDVVEIERCNQDFIKVGDIVLYRHAPAPVVVHRVIAVLADCETKRFVTQGDLCDHADGIIQSEYVLGRVTVIEHAGVRIKVDSIQSKIYALLWTGFSPLGRYLFLAYIHTKKILGLVN